MQVDASGTSAARYFRELHAVRTASHTAALGINANLGGRTKLVASQVASYSPSYLYGLFPREAQVGDVIPTAPDYNVDVSNAQSYSYGTKLDLTRGLSRRTSLSASGELQYTDFRRSTATRRDVGFHRMGVRFSRGMGRHSSWHVGYDYRGGQFGFETVTRPTGGGQQTSENAIRVGAEYTRPLSATRRLVVDASFASAAVASSRVRSYRFLGETTANYQFSRVWQSGATLRRSFEYVPEFLTPVLSTSLSARIEGRVWLRSTLSASGGYSTGESALGLQESVLVGDRFTFRTYTANARLQHALNGTVAAYAENLYYFYDVSGRAASATALARGLERNGVRVGLTLQVPAFRR